jgi:hypothetical protein
VLLTHSNSPDRRLRITGSAALLTRWAPSTLVSNTLIISCGVVATVAARAGVRRLVADRMRRAR